MRALPRAGLAAALIALATVWAAGWAATPARAQDRVTLEVAYIPILPMA